nr:5-formyltetrahydrofolate cyclo-ligase [Bacteroides faecis]
MSTRNSSRFTPIIIAISVVAGILIGTFYAKHFAGNRLGIINGSSNKLNALLRIVDDQYVDTVNMTDLVEKAMPQILAELDPHSTYIPAQNLEEVNSELEGSFSGIGIQFTIQNDTIHVNAVIQGGPSEKVGLMAGDRIVNVDDSLFVGKKLNNELAMRTLKGPKGSQVKLGVKRVGEPKLLDFTITRGDIPQNTVDAAYMLNDDIGYVKVSKFGRTSHVELLNALAQLNHKKCKGLIIDLRGNTGGYMEAAIRMVNEFLPEGKLIVYTQGRKYPRSEEFANGTGSCQKMPLVVLIDEGSASASEIFTGAIQDNDRGTVVGRRSFGKGLVQQPIDFSDGSAIRLTIARYYTPSGRCIQRPYESGKDRNYELDLYNRYEHGEFFSRDSIKQNENERYLTSLGRTVYGGGGIMPDVFVPQDTTGVTSYLSSVINRGLTLQFTFQYTDNNRKKLSQYETEEELLNYLRHQGLVEQFIRFADTKGVKRRNILIQKSYKRLEANIYGNIIYNMLGLEAYLKYFNKSDATVQQGIELLEKGEAFPKAPVETEEEVTKEKKDGKKKELRKLMASLKIQHESSTLQKLQSAKILAALEAHPAFRAATTVLLYHSLKDEVDTHAFIRKWSNEKRILLPVVVGDDLELRLYTGPEDMATGTYGIEEPVGETFTDYASINFIAVPGVAFDRKGNRLGRGKGYYDRLLPRIPAAYKAGICFPFQVVEEVPAETFDICMDIIITSNEDELSHPHHPLPSCDRE